MPLRALIVTLVLLCPAPARAQPDVKKDAPTPQAAPAVQAPDAPKPEPKITRQPVLKGFVEAPYPDQAFEAGISGEVQLEIEVDDKGAVKGVAVLTPGGHGFDEAATAAARRFAFEPAEIDGKPAPVKIVYRYRFTIEQQRPKAAGKAAGPPNFYGTVRERGTRAPIALANLAIEPVDAAGKPVSGAKGFETTTDEAGAFALAGVPPGRFRVTIAAADFFKFETVDDVAEGKATEAVYYVQRLSYNKFETVIRGKKEKKEIVKRSLELEEIRKIPGTGGDAIRVVQNLPGVARTPMNVGGLIVRGSQPKDTRVFIDGVQLPLLFHFSGLTSTYNSDLLSGIEFMPGGASARYGRGTAGVVELKTRNGKTDRLHGYLDVNLFEATAMAEGPITEDMQFIAAVRRSYIDAVLGYAASFVKGLDLTMAPRYYDYQARWSYAPTKRDSWTVTGFGSDDRMAFVMSKSIGTNDPTVVGEFTGETMNHRVIGTWTRRGPDTTATLTLSPGYDTQQYTAASKFDFNLTRALTFARADLSTRMSQALTLNYGFDGLFGYLTADGVGPRPPASGGMVSIPVSAMKIFKSGGDADVFGPAIYLEFETRPVPQVKVVPGVRAEYTSYVNQIVAEPRLAAFYEVVKTVTLKASAGQYHDLPFLIFMGKDYGNPRLHLEQAWQYDVGCDWRPHELLTLTVDVFYKDLSDLVASTTATAVRDGGTVALNYANRGVGHAYGAEVMLRHDPSKYFFGWLAYTLMKSETKAAPDADWRLSPFDQTHILTVLGTFHLPANWDLGFRFRLVSGNPATPIFGGVYDADYDNYWPFPGRINSERLPLFHQLDVRVDKKFVFDTWMLDAYLDVLNVYNHRSIEGLFYNYDFTDYRYLQGLPIIPMLGVKAEF